LDVAAAVLKEAQLLSFNVECLCKSVVSPRAFNLVNIRLADAEKYYWECLRQLLMEDLRSTILRHGPCYKQHEKKMTGILLASIAENKQWMSRFPSTPKNNFHCLAVANGREFLLPL